MYTAIVRFNDGTLFASGYVNSSSSLVPRLFASELETEDWFNRYVDGAVERPECECGREEDAEVASYHGGGHHWAVVACKHCLSLKTKRHCEETQGFGGYTQEEWHEEVPKAGYPSWFDHSMAQHHE
jgi:hypothetical protein